MRDTRNRNLPICAALFAVAFFAASAHSANEALSELVHVDLSKQAEMLRIAELISDPSARHEAAVQQLIHLASTYAVMPAEVRDLLIRATSVPDPWLSRLVAEALYLFENRAPSRELAPRQREVGEDALIAESKRESMESATQSLAQGGPEQRDRLGAVQTLVHLLSTAPALSYEVTDSLERLRTDSDPEIAHLAEKALAIQEARSLDPALVLPVARSMDKGPATAGAAEELAFAELQAERPGARLAALELILDAALCEHRRDDARVLNAFTRLLDDPDSRVAYRAANALAGLAGDDNALADVYVAEGP